MKVSFRLNGETRSIDYATDPGLQVGTLVRFDNGTVVVQ